MEENALKTATSTVATASTEPTTEAVEVQEPKLKGWDNIKEIGGLEFSAFGMSVVFIGLILTFCYISIIPRLAGVKQPKVAKQTDKPAAIPATESSNQEKSTEGLSPELQAAIAYVIAAEYEYEQLTDYTKITIRRDENQEVWGVAGKMRTLATRKLN